MSEKRFIVESVEIFECCEFDKRIVKAITDKNELYTYSDIYEIADLLNEQQTTINKQLDQIIELQDKYRILEFNHSRLEKRNKAQYEKIGEQQATISQLKQEIGEWKKENRELLDQIQEFERIPKSIRELWVE